MLVDYKLCVMLADLWFLTDTKIYFNNTRLRLSISILEWKILCSTNTTITDYYI